ncbi:MAG: hypothetical protein ACTSQY_06200 [Candidatus Odinarchaeia archaeon]
MENFKTILDSAQNEDLDKEKVRKLVCILWVLKDLGLIDFDDRNCGIAIGIQEMLIGDKVIAAKTLMGLLESSITKISDETITINEQ